MNEGQFKVWFRENWKGWMSAYEPRKGGTVGIADLQILVKGRLVPVELKIAEFSDEGLVIPERIRPAQIQWHAKLAKAGGFSIIVFGIGEAKQPEEILWYPGGKANSLLKPFEPGKNEFIDVNNFHAELHDILAFRMGCYT